MTSNAIETQVTLLKNLVGKDNRICYLKNATEYDLEYVLIIQDDRGFRIIVKSFVTIVSDRRYKTLRRAKASILKFLELDRVKLMLSELPKWSQLFYPDDDFYYNMAGEIMSYWRYKLKKKGPTDSETVGEFVKTIQGKFSTILIDPPWRFHNRSGKVAPEHKRLNRYETLSLEEIKDLPIFNVAAEQSHLYLWVPNALLEEGVKLLEHWGFTYKTNLVWCKVRKDGEVDGSGVGFYFRNATELILFGVKGELRTLPPGRRQENLIFARKTRHSQKPEEFYHLIEECSPGPYLELFARKERPGWTQWGNELKKSKI